MCYFLLLFLSGCLLSFDCCSQLPCAAVSQDWQRMYVCANASGGRGYLCMLSLGGRDVPPRLLATLSFSSSPIRCSSCVTYFSPCESTHWYQGMFKSLFLQKSVLQWGKLSLQVHLSWNWHLNCAYTFSSSHLIQSQQVCGRGASPFEL